MRFDRFQRCHRSCSKPPDGSGAILKKAQAQSLDLIGNLPGEEILFSCEPFPFQNIFPFFLVSWFPDRFLSSRFSFS